MVIGTKNESAVLNAFSRNNYVEQVFECGLLECLNLPWLAALPDRVAVFNVLAGQIIPVNSRPFWPALEHEPLVVGLTFCLSAVSPWQVKQNPKILGLERKLHEMWTSQDINERDFLCKLCNSPWRMAGL